MAASFSQAGGWLVDSDVGWQMRQHELNLTLAAPHFASPAQRLDAIVFKVLGPEFVGLDLRRPSAITADWPLVRSPTPVLLAIVTYIVTVWLWSSSIRRAGLKPRSHDPKWLQALVVVHNSFLCALSFYMGVGILTEARRHKYRHSPTAFLCYSQSRAHLYHSSLPLAISCSSLWCSHSQVLALG